MKDLRRDVAAKLADPALQAALAKALATVRRKSSMALAELEDLEAARELAGRTRQENVSLLKGNLERLEQNLTEAGTETLWAEDDRAATALVADIVKEHKALRVTMSKTMVGEEIELERAVRAAGANVVQTDLGERVVQLAGQRPSHITVPCLHMNAAEVGRILHTRAGMELSEDPATISRRLARALRPVLMQSQLGITGANFAVAETGNLVIVENEGNVRMGWTIPPVHVVVTGVEKVVGNMAEARLMLAILARHATGQRTTCYTSVLTPAALPHQKRYVVLVDNGRTDVFTAGPFRDLLRCIRCGRCLNVCPVYERVGGHAYGWTYPGPIGIALAPLAAPATVGATAPDLCTLCGACTDACPVRIPLDRLIVLAREKANRLRPVQEVKQERRALKLMRLGTRGAWAYRVSHLGHRWAGKSASARLSRLETALGWAGERMAPEPAAELFRTWYRKRKKETGIG